MKKILIVDDQFLFRQMLEMTLSSQYTIINAEDGKVALEKVKAEKPDLIILDLMMPEVDGFDVLKAIKGDENLKKTKIIILTAKHDHTVFSKAIELGADEFIAKPFEIDYLEQRIEHHLKNS